VCIDSEEIYITNKGDNPPGQLGVRRGADDPTVEKTLVMKSKEGIGGWKYLRRSGECLKDLKIGTWNVLSLYQPEALKMLLEQ
jgi:hypothetical protein